MKMIAYVALAVLAVAAPTSAQNAARIEIQLANFKFTPADIKLAAGQPVTLHFVNKGSGGHDFTAPEFFKAATMDAATRTKLGKKGRIDLSAGESADVTLTPKAGAYKVKCGHFLHAGFGMTGTITVG
jgi:plastocyanin